MAPDSVLGKEIRATQFREEKEDPGFFSYTTDGFRFKGHQGEKMYKWSDIETVFGYKEDWMTIDEICMDIFTTDQSGLKITEGTPGWYQFQKKLKEHIPAIPDNWDGIIAVPAFEAMLTLLYDRKGRTLQEAESAHYPGA